MAMATTINNHRLRLRLRFIWLNNSLKTSNLILKPKKPKLNKKERNKRRRRKPNEQHVKISPLTSALLFLLFNRKSVISQGLTPSKPKIKNIKSGVQAIFDFNKKN